MSLTIAKITKVEDFLLTIIIRITNFLKCFNIPMYPPTCFTDSQKTEKIPPPSPPTVELECMLFYYERNMYKKKSFRFTPYFFFQK